MTVFSKGPWPEDEPSTMEGEQVEEYVAQTRFKFETVADLRHMPELEYLVPMYILASGAGLIYGKWASGKSFLAYDLAFHLAYGMKDWHGVPLSGKPVYVLIIAREGHQGYLRRLDAFKKHHGLTEDPEHIIFMRSSISFTDDAAFNALKKDVETLRKPFAMTLVDTAGRVLPGADMAKELVVTLFMERLLQLGETAKGVAIGVHHENKSGGLNGSMYFENNSDLIFRMERQGTGSLESVKLTCQKMKDDEDKWSRTITFKKIELDGDKSSLVIESISDQKVTEPKKPTDPWNSKPLRALRAAIDEVAAIDHRVSGDGQMVKAAKMEAVRDAFNRKYATGEGAKDIVDAKRKAWVRALNDADKYKLTGSECDPVTGVEMIWIARAEQNAFF
jgi:hypothetical protein